MKNITRIQGFINLDEIAKEPSFKIIPWTNNMKDEYGCSNIQFIFSYKGEDFIYKTPTPDYKCYYELIAEELAHDFGMPSAHYDLAKSQEYGKGVISKNFKLPNTTYTRGDTLLEDYVKNCLYKDKILNAFEIEQETEKYNSLEGIWAAFEYRYLNHPNRIEIVNKLMNQLVDVFIFDTLTGHNDRHNKNWGIAENKEDIFLQPLYDNECILFKERYFYFSPHTESNRGLYLNFTEGIKNLLSEFLSVSDTLFIERLTEKLPLIHQENIDNIFLKLENRTKTPIPKNIKKRVKANFKTIETIVKTTLSEYEENKKIR